MNISEDKNRIVPTPWGDVRIEDGYGYIECSDNSGELVMKLPDGVTDEDILKIYSSISYIF